MVVEMIEDKFGLDAEELLASQYAEDLFALLDKKRAPIPYPTPTQFRGL